MDTVDFDSDNSYSFDDWEYYEAIDDWEYDEPIEIDGVIYWSPSKDDIDYTICKIPVDYAEIIDSIREQEWQEACADIMDQEEARLLDLVSLITPSIYPTFKAIYARLTAAEIFSDEQFSAINELSALLAPACESKGDDVAEILEAYQIALGAGLI